MSAPVGTKTDKEIGVAVLGLGNVGSEVVRIIDDSAADLCARVGAPLVVRGIGVRRIADDRGVPTELLTDNIEGLVSREDVDIVVEVMGPVEPARKAILSALEQGKSVVTANKALMAVAAGEIASAAESANVDLYFEAAVAGAIPVIRPLTQSLAGDTVLRVAGIVNGTTNYILDRMDTEGADFGEVLAQAQALGYAEADPTADVEGYDAAQKAAISGVVHELVHALEGSFSAEHGVGRPLPDSRPHQELSGGGGDVVEAALRARRRRPGREDELGRVAPVPERARCMPQIREEVPRESARRGAGLGLSPPSAERFTSARNETKTASSYRSSSSPSHAARRTAPAVAAGAAQAVAGLAARNRDQRLVMAEWSISRISGGIRKNRIRCSFQHSPRGFRRLGICGTTQCQWS